MKSGTLLSDPLVITDRTVSIVRLSAMCIIMGTTIHREYIVGNSPLYLILWVLVHPSHLTRFVVQLVVEHMQCTVQQQHTGQYRQHGRPPAPHLDRKGALYAGNDCRPPGLAANPEKNILTPPHIKNVIMILTATDCAKYRIQCHTMFF